METTGISVIIIGPAGMSVLDYTFLGEKAMAEKAKKIVMFSGGKDSTAMLLNLVEKEIPFDDIIMADLGMEFPEMYKHVLQVEKFINKKITIVKPENTFEYYMLEHIKVKGKRKGQAGYSFPDMMNRWCTSLKRDTIKKHIKEKYGNKSLIEYHGITLNEKKRQSKNKANRVIKTPLIRWRMSEKDTLKYCYDKGFTWGGLYEKFSRVSCWCCPLQRMNELEIIYKEYPEYWEKLKMWESSTYRTFRYNQSILDLENKFNEYGQGKLF